MWDSLKSILGTVAPFLASTLGGPLAGGAVTKICDALGLTSSQQSPQEIISALNNATPEQLLALKEAEQAHQELMTKLGYDQVAKLDALVVDDRKDARAKETATHDATPKKLAFFVTAGFFGLLALLCFWQVPPPSQAILQVMTGALGTAWYSIISYYFGDTAGHSETQHQLGDQIAVNATQTK